MAKSTLAELVTKLSVESTQFKKELEKASAKSVAFGKSQKTAANDSVFANKKMSDAFRQAANSASTLQGPMGGVSSRLSTLATGFTSVGVAATAFGLAISGLAVIGGLSIGAFAKMEKRLFRTEALFKATSGAAGLTTDELANLANTVAEDTLASVEGVTQAINVLQTFKSVSGEAFERTLELSQDLAAVMGSDIKNSALQLGKALEDPVTGLNALRRSGVSFTNDQKLLIASLVETGQKAEAQKLILDTLERQVGGAGAAEGAGLSGAVDLLGQRWGEFLEQLGKTSGIGETTEDALNGISGALNSITRSFGGGEDLDALRERLAKVNEHLSYDKIPVYNKNRLEALKKSLESEIKEITDRQNKEREIIKKGEEEKKKSQEEAIASKQKKEEAAGLLSLRHIQRSLASQTEIYTLQYEDRNKKIGELILSQEELTRLGYENLTDLQRDFIDQSAQMLTEQIDKLESQEQKRLDQQANQMISTQQSLQSSILSNSQQLASGFQQLAEEGSAAQKAAFYAQQGIAFAMTLINTHMAATAALAPPPVGLGPVAGAPYSAVIKGIGYANAGLIAAQTIAGAREMGGPVSGGKTYLVGEKGPELFTAGASGQITSNDNLNKALGYSTDNSMVFNINSGTASPQEVARAVVRYAKGRGSKAFNKAMHKSAKRGALYAS